MPTPQFRSLVSVILPRYFDHIRFIRNQYVGADAVVLPIRSYEHNIVDQKRTLDVAHRDHNPPLSFKLLMYVDVTDENPAWSNDIKITAHENIYGYVYKAMNVQDIDKVSKLLRNEEQRIGASRDYFKMFPIVRDADILCHMNTQRVQAAVLEHRFVVHALRTDQLTAIKLSKIEGFVETVKRLGIHPMKKRTVRKKIIVDRIEAKFRQIHQLGITGMMFESHTLIPTANRIFASAIDENRPIEDHLLNE